MTAAPIAFALAVAANLIIWGSQSAAVRRVFAKPAAPASHRGAHASTERIRCGGRITEQVMPRKQTADHPPWHTAPLAVLPALDEEACELIRAEYVRERVPVYGEVPQLEVLAAVRDGLLTPGVAEAQRLAKAMIA